MATTRFSGRKTCSYEAVPRERSSNVIRYLKLRYFWPKMQEEVAQVVSQCMCSRGKSRVPQKTTLKFQTLRWKPFSHPEMDLVGALLVISHGFGWITVVEDYLTKYVQIFPIVSEDALTIAALLVHEVFYRFGSPTNLQSDQGSEFNNLLLRGILDATVVIQIISSAYHSMSQGSVERFNGTMKTYLSRIPKTKKLLGYGSCIDFTISVSNAIWISSLIST